MSIGIILIFKKYFKGSDFPLPLWISVFSQGALFPIDNLAHSAVDGRQACIMQIQQNSGHAKTQQTQRTGVGNLRCSCRHEGTTKGRSFMYLLLSA